MVTRLSPHFTASEFACHHCGKVIVSQRLVARLELLRARIGKPLRIVSGYRCPVHNAEVGGAKASQHLVGQAADIPIDYCNWQDAKAVGFTGVGHRNGKVTHVDVRPGAFVLFKD